jgi:hypothetical protein
MFGDSTQTLQACDCPTCTPPGHSVTGGDCAVMDPARHPGAPELCNGLDDDCNMQVDDGAVVGAGGACSDAGIGLCASGTYACVGGRLACTSTYVRTLDVCDGMDNDCDGMTDEQPDCHGPAALPMSGVLTAAFDTQTSDPNLASPTQCLKGTGVAESWTPALGPWSGSRHTWHYWYAEAPGNTTWDLTGATLHLQFRATMLNATDAGWDGFNMPIVLLCNADPMRFSRYRPLTALMAQRNVNVSTDLHLAAPADGGWLNPLGGVDMVHVKRIEVMLKPEYNGAVIPSFTINFDNATGFR